MATPNCNKCEYRAYRDSFMYCTKCDHSLNQERRKGQKAPDWCPYKTNLEANKKRRKKEGYLYI